MYGGIPRTEPVFPLARQATARCKTCKGRGRVHKPLKHGNALVDAVVTCPECGGTGRPRED